MPDVSPQAPPPSRLRVGISSAMLAAYTAMILVVTLRPTPVTEGANKALIDRVLNATHDAGIPDAFNFHSLQFGANIAMFVPFGFLLALVLPRERVWLALLGAPAFSATIELVQQVFLPARSGDVWDVVANALGGAVGVALAVWLWALIRKRDERVVARAFHFSARESE